MELVLQYAQDKDKEPELHIVPDEELKKNGFNVVSAEEAGKMLVAIAKGEFGVDESFQNSEFEASSGPKGPSLRGQEVRRGVDRRKLIGKMHAGNLFPTPR